METFSLSKLNAYIKRVLAINFQEPIWITAELLSLKMKAGHAYLELTEKDDTDVIIAQSSAVIWKTNYLHILKTSAVDLSQILKEGNEIKVLVQVDFNSRYGLKLLIKAIDTAYTLGKIAQARMVTIERLKQEGVWQQNKNRTLPIAFRNIAVVGSSQSAGFKDFENHLAENQFAYRFNIQLYDVSVQGENAISEISNAFFKINSKSELIDVVVLIRGGGSKHDLIEFDSYEISRCISISDIPVLTGIGHYIDESIADLSAHQSFKTPTAVADYIIAVNRSFELTLQDFMNEIRQTAFQYVIFGKQKLSELKHLYKSGTSEILKRNEKEFVDLKYKINFDAHQFLSFKAKELERYNTILASNDPEFIMKKGYSLTYYKEKLIKDLDALQPGDLITSVFLNGSISSTINQGWQKKN